MGSNYFDSDEANKFIDKMNQKEYEFFNVLLNEEMLGGACEPVEEILRNYFGELGTFAAELSENQHYEFLKGSQLVYSRTEDKQYLPPRVIYYEPYEKISINMEEGTTLVDLIEKINTKKD